MAAAKRKPDLLAVLGGAPDGAPAEDDGEAVDGKTEAAQSLLDAIAEDDAGAVASAFQALYDQCASGHEDEDI